MKHHLFPTSFNLIMHSPKNIPITPKKFDVNRTNYPNKSSFKLLGSQKQQLSEIIISLIIFLINFVIHLITIMNVK